MKIKKIDIIYIIFLLFLLQPPIENIFPAFSYYDEIFVIVLFVNEIYRTIKTKNTYKYKLNILSLFIMITIIGTLGNIYSSANQPLPAILQDILSNAKLPLIAVSAGCITLNEFEKEKLSDRLHWTIRFLFIVMFTCAILSQFLNIGMTSKIRNGIKSFRFIYPGPAGLNTYFYLFFIIYSITLVKNNKLRTGANFFIFCGLVPWILTMRSRAFLFAGIYLILYLYIFYFKGINIRKLFRIENVIIVTLLVLLVSRDSIINYFMENEAQARYQLSRKAFQIANNNFPLGAGFGTFGTQASRVYYSDIYYQYGLSSVYGLGPSDPKYVTDQYIFGIIGQFGYIGTICVSFIIYLLYKNIWSFSKYQGNFQLAALFLFSTSIFACITAGTFIQASIIPSVLVFYLFNNESLE